MKGGGALAAPFIYKSFYSIIHRTAKAEKKGREKKTIENKGTSRQGNKGTGKQGNRKTKEQGNKKIRKQADRETRGRL